MSERSDRCWICGRKRGLEPLRDAWSLNMPTVFVPRTGDPDDKPAQISNDVMVGAYVYRNGGSAKGETHICNQCITVGARAIKVRLSEVLEEIDPKHDLEAEVARLTARLASTQNALQNVCHDHDRMQKRLAYVLSLIDASEHKGDDELGDARWEAGRGRATP